MAVAERITCDICGIQKGEANHWMLWRPEFPMPGPNGEVGGIRIAPWHQDLFREYNHLCGESCASRLLARSFQEWHDLADKTPVITYAPRISSASH